MKLTALTAAMALAFIGTVGAQTTQRLTADKLNEYGLVYSLPMTVVDITVETEHTIETPGEFNNYATRHLGLTDGVVRKPSHRVVVKSITLTPRGVANPQNRWTAQFKSGHTPTMILTADGVPLSINAEVDEPELPTLPKAVAAQPTPLEGTALREAMTEAITRSTTTAKKAEMTAARIFELRDRRNDIFSGDAENMPPDGRSTELILAGISAQEAALTAMFAGTVQTFTEVSTLTYTPSTTAEDRVLLARISPVDGVVEKDDLSGIPLYLSYEILTEGKLPVNDKGEVKKFPKGGVAYTIPGSARITLTFNGKTIAQEDVDIAQLGATFGIDPGLFTDKKAPAYVEFSPVTGAVVKLGTMEK